MREALKDAVVPELRARGFQGSFPYFRRINTERIDLLTFQFSQLGPSLYVEIGSCRADGRNAPSKTTIHDSGLFRRRIGPQPSIDFAGIGDPGADHELMTHVLNAITIEGELWWSAPKSIRAP